MPIGWQMELPNGQRAGILEWKPPRPPSRRLHLVIDTTDSCWGAEGFDAARLPREVDTLLRCLVPIVAPDDRCVLWRVGDVRPALDCEVGVAAELPRRLGDLLVPVRGGSWLARTLQAIASYEGQRRYRGGESAQRRVLLATDGEMFDAPPEIEMSLRRLHAELGAHVGLVALSMRCPTPTTAAILESECQPLVAPDSLRRFLESAERSFRVDADGWLGRVIEFGSTGELRLPAADWTLHRGGEALRLVFVGAALPRITLRECVAEREAAQELVEFRPLGQQAFAGQERLAGCFWAWHEERLQEVLDYRLHRGPRDAVLSCACGRETQLSAQLEKERSFFCTHCRRLLLARSPTAYVSVQTAQRLGVEMAYRFRIRDGRIELPPAPLTGEPPLDPASLGEGGLIIHLWKRSYL